MDEKLRKAAHDGNIDSLYELIQEDPTILKLNIDDKLMLAETPLHVAASMGNHHFAAELMKLMPAYARMLNLDGLTPIHVALRNGLDHMVEWLVSVDGNMVRHKGGNGTMTCLHYVTFQGNFRLLRLFLLACPDSIEDLTSKRETALHIALTRDDPRIFEALVGWLRKVNREDILNWPDEDGHTVLHVATLYNRTEALNLLLSKTIIREIKVNAKNKMGLTALDILPHPLHSNNLAIKDMLIRAEALRGEDINDDADAHFAEIVSMSMNEKLDKYFGLGVGKKSPVNKDMSQAVLTVAVLIATATFQAVLSPPGGLWQDEYIPEDNNPIFELGVFYLPPHIIGTTTMTPFQFIAFYFLNSVTFYASMSIIYLHTQHLVLLNMSQIFLSATYCCSLILISPILGKSHWVNVLFEFVIMVIQMLFFVLAFGDVWRLQKYSIRLAELIIVPYNSGKSLTPYFIIFFLVVPFVLMCIVFLSTVFVGLGYL